MNAHSTSPASVTLPGAEAPGKSTGWLSSQVRCVQEQAPLLPTGPSRLEASIVPDRSVTSGEDAASTLRGRLLQMIVANEQSRKSQPAVSGPRE